MAESTSAFHILRRRWLKSICAIECYLVVTGLHDDPVAIQLLFGLQKVAPVRPERSRLVGDNSYSRAARETRYKFKSPVVFRHHFALNNKTKQNTKKKNHDKLNKTNREWPVGNKTKPNATKKQSCCVKDARFIPAMNLTVF